MSTTIQRDGRTWHVDDSGITTLTRNYTLLLDTNNLSANGEISSFASIPAIGSSHPSYSALKVQSYDVNEGEGSEKKLLKITVNYGQNDGDSGEDSEGNEYSIEHWGWDSGTSDQELVTDISGNPLLNSAKDPFDSVPVIQVPTPTFTKTVKYSARKSGWNTLIGCVNSGSITIGGISFPKWTLLCNLSEERIYGDPTFKYRYTVQLKYKSCKAKLYGADSEEEIGWQLAIVDTGMREIGPDGKKRIIQLPSSNSGVDVAIASSTLLDGNGHVLSADPNDQNPPKPYCGLFYGYVGAEFPSWMTAEEEG